MIKNYKYGELFCGPGGLSLGAIKTELQKDGDEYRITHAWATDYDADSCKTYKNNICPNDGKFVICQDVSELVFESLPQIDIFAYGFPCNDFSIVGEQKGFNGGFGGLYSYGLKILNSMKPLCFVAENVNGLTSANNGVAFSQILRDLENAGDGYNIIANLYKAEEYGVPQSRHRIIMVGFAKTSGLWFKVPKPITILNPVSAKSAIENPPIEKNAPNNEQTRQSKQVVERLKYIKPGENCWDADLPEHLKLNVKAAKLSQIYKRLDPDKPSYTITGSGGGGTHVYHYSENRALTNRERARLQTFPDDFVFHGSKESVRRQIGMAVPPKLAQIIFESILKTIAGVSYNSVEPNINNNKSLFESW